MSQFLRKYLQGDGIIWVVFILLCLSSAIAMFSASSSLAFNQQSHTGPIISHVTYLLFGIFAAFCIHRMSEKYIRFCSYLGLLASLIMLVMLPFCGIEINGAKRWLPILGMTIQPSEFAKISLILVVADLMSRIKSKDEESKYFYAIILLTSVICFLIMISNLSTAVLLGAVILLMLFIAGISWKKVATILLILASVGLAGYFIGRNFSQEELPSALKRLPTWVSRIDNMIEGKSNPNSKFEVRDDNWQIVNSSMAVARGGLIGVGAGNSIQRSYLPLAFADSIYAIVIEEFGLAGGIWLIILYMVLLYKAGEISRKSKAPYPAMTAIGLMLMIALQAFISMGVSVDLGIVTGQPLPLISRGGTSILITSAYFGVMLALTRELKQEEDVHIEDNVAEPESEIPSVNLNDI